MNIRYHGFDYLRAFLPFFVVMVHSPRTCDVAVNEFSLGCLYRYNILFLAVPVFILISVYLYITSEKPGLVQRLKRYGLLVSFWYLTYSVVNNGTPEVIKDFKYLISGSIDTLVIIFSAGETIYYYFVSIMFCMLLARVSMKLSMKVIMMLFVLSLGYLFVIPFVTPKYPQSLLKLWFNPFNFLPYVFLAFLIKEYYSAIVNNIWKHVLGGFVLCLIFSLIEWAVHHNHPALMKGLTEMIPGYPRASLVFGAYTLFVLSLSVTRKSGPIIQFMSKYSLAVYCLHMFYLPLVRTEAATYTNYPNLVLFLIPIVLMILSYITARLLKPFINPKLLF